MFSFASKMLNSLIGEGEQPPRPQGPRPPLQPGPGMQPPYTRPIRPQAPVHRAPGQDMGRPRLAVLGRNPSSQMQQLPPPRKVGGPEEPNLDLSHLSAEERAMIQNVMQKAKTLEDHPKVDQGMNTALRNQQEAMRLAQAQAMGPQGMGPRPGMYGPYNNEQNSMHLQQHTSMQQHTNIQHTNMQQHANLQQHSNIQQHGNVQQHPNMQQHNNAQLHSTMQQQIQNQARQDTFNQSGRLDPYKRPDNYSEVNQRQENLQGSQQSNFQAQGFNQQRNEFRQENFSNGYSQRQDQILDQNLQEHRAEQARQEAQARQDMQTRQDLQARQDLQNRQELQARQDHQTRQDLQARPDQYRQGHLQDHNQMHRSEPFRQDVIQDQLRQDQLNRQDLQSSQFKQDGTIQDHARQELIGRQDLQSRNEQFRQEEFSLSQRQQDPYSNNPSEKFQLNRQDSYKQNNAFINSACWERSDKVEPEEEPGDVRTCEAQPPPVSQIQPSEPTCVQQPVAKDEIKPPSLIESFYDHSPGEVYTIPEEEDEISSPTGGDGVTSLRKQRLAAGAQPLCKSAVQNNGSQLNSGSVGPVVSSGSEMKGITTFIQSSSKSFSDTQSSLMGQSTSLTDGDVSESLNGYNLTNSHDVLYGRNNHQRKNDAIQNDLSKRLANLGISDSLKHLGMKTELEGPSAKSPLTTHKWSTAGEFNEKPMERDDLQQEQAYKQFLQNDKQQPNHLHQSSTQVNHNHRNDQQQIGMQHNRSTTEISPQNYSPKSTSPVQRTSPQSFHIRPKTQFPMKSNHVDTGIVSKDETWKSPFNMQEDMRYQQMVHQEYPMDTMMYHNRGKPRALHLQGETVDEQNKQTMPKQANTNQQANQQANQAGKPTAGTISGMLADFSRALGLSSTTSPSRPSPCDDLTSDNQLTYQDSHSQDHNQTYQRPLTQQQIQAQIKANEQFMHGNQSQNDKSMMQQYQQNQYAYDNKGLIASDLKAHDPYGLQQKGYGVPQSVQATQHMLNQQQNQQLAQNYSYSQDPQVNRLQMQQSNLYQQQIIQQQLQQQQLQQQTHQQQLQQNIQGQLQRTNEYQLGQMGDPEQQLYQQQHQMFQKLSEYQPVFAQNLTPQQQQMYQQHMQLQHHAQHLKKISRRSMPHSNIDTQRQGQFQKKENLISLIGQSTAVGSGVTLQQLGAAQLVNQQTGTVQLLNSQHLPGYISTDKLNALSRSTAVSSQPVIVTSNYGTQVNSVTPLGTPQSTPVGTPRGPRDGGDSSDTMSETDSQKSLRTRRKLPSIPTDQEAVTLPSAKKRDRGKIKSPHERFSPSCSPLRQFGDGGYRIASNLMLQRSSASETNLRKVTHGPDPIPRPGSALGLLQGSSVVSSSGIRTDYSKEAEIASCLPPDLRHLLSSYKGTESSSYSSNKSSILQTYKDSLSNEMKISAADRRALGRLSDWDSERLLDRNKDLLRSPKSRFDIQRKIAFSGIGRSRKLRAHRRQLSDPKLHLDVHPMKDTGETSYSRSYLGIGPPNLRPPYKSYEYESIDDGKTLEWDHSQPYLSSYAMAGGALRETAINSVLDSEHFSNDPSRYEMRRYSDSFEWRRRDVGGSKGRKPRSWQPSPFASDDEEDSMNREQKKAKIKAEIARRRQQIEENARLHEELLRLARLRESAELGYTPVGGTIAYSGGYARSSVLKSIDDLLGSRDSPGYSSHRTAEDRSMDRIASTFRTDDYTSGVYERLSDFSPVTEYSTPHAMPLLPDMPTRSRKLLQDLGSSPISESVLGMQQKAKALL